MTVQEANRVLAKLVTAKAGLDLAIIAGRWPDVTAHAEAIQQLAGELAEGTRGGPPGAL